MTRLKIFVFTLIALVFADSRAEWERVGGTQFIDIYINPSTVKIQNGFTKGWYMYDFKKAERVNGLESLSMKGLGFFDCKNDRVNVNTIVYYKENMGMGRTIGDQSPPQSGWSPIVPDSVFALLLETMCAITETSKKAQ